MSDWNDQVIADFTAGKERLGGMFDRSALLLLHTTGRRTGEDRVSPLAYFADGGDLLIVASAAGRHEHPAWFFNLQAQPQVRVERWSGDAIESFGAAATELEGPERDRVFADIVAKAPGFGDYQTKTSRVIPVVRLTRT